MVTASSRISVAITELVSESMEVLKRASLLWSGNKALYLVNDFVLWVLVTPLAALIRFEFSPARIDFQTFLLFGILIGSVFVSCAFFLGLYSQRFIKGSIDELLALVAVTLIATLPVFLIIFFLGSVWGLPRSIVVIGALIFLPLSSGLRLMHRLIPQYQSSGQTKGRAIIYGAGSLAQILIPQLLADQSGSFIPVALLDDDPQKQGRRIAGIRTSGALSELGAAAKRTNADTVIVAVPRADRSLLKSVKEMAEPHALRVVVLPTLSELLESSPNTIELSGLRIEELIGRRAVAVEMSRVRDYISGNVVLVTGAGGSIGSELCLQVSRLNPKRIVFLDHDETALHETLLKVVGSGMVNNDDHFLADLRDFETIRQVFNLVKPDVVFHAAALKHLPALERFPKEAWKTNVLGTLNVLKAASEVRVKQFVNISTDKAADPTSRLGHSKLLAERLTSWFSSNSSGKYSSVRFGNVVGSRGSLVPTVRELVKQGGPVAVTHPEATRYFMSIPEACQLVLQAGAEEARNSVFLLDMGEPVSVLEVVNRIIADSGKRVEVTFTGLRKGEKIHEDLWGENESLVPSGHPLIWVVESNPIDPEELTYLETSFSD